MASFGDSDAGFDQRLKQRLRSQTGIELHPVVAARHRGRIPNSPAAVSTISFILGGLFFTSVFAFFSKPDPIFDQSQVEHQAWSWTTPCLSFFISAISAFHILEFLVTAIWNREKCSVDSFLLENGAMYYTAHGFALAEYLISLYLFPSWNTHPFVSIVGIVLVISGQIIRSMAMIHASTNFSHSVAFVKAEHHQLVTSGIYSWLRHPSYAGYYYWALGTQLVLQNPISFIIYSVVLWRFFFYRIQDEERALVKFFGESYAQYRRRVGTSIPFIP